MSKRRSSMGKDPLDWIQSTCVTSGLDVKSEEENAESFDGKLLLSEESVDNAKLSVPEVDAITITSEDNSKMDSKPKQRVYSKVNNSASKGLSAGWTRATFIVTEETLDKIKDLAYTRRESLKDIVEDALREYLQGKKTISRKVKGR